MDFLLCKLQISGKHKKNAKGDYDYAAPLTASHPHGFSGDHRRSAAKVLAPGAHSQFGSGKNTQFEPEQRANPFENVFSKTAVFPPPAIAETDL